MPYRITDNLSIGDALNDLDRRLQKFEGVLNIDLNQRRVINAGHSRNARDYCTREELLNLKSELESIIEALETEVGRLDQRVYDLENP